MHRWPRPLTRLALSLSWLALACSGGQTGTPIANVFECPNSAALRRLTDLEGDYAGVAMWLPHGDVAASANTTLRLSLTLGGLGEAECRNNAVRAKAALKTDDGLQLELDGRLSPTPGSAQGAVLELTGIAGNDAAIATHTDAPKGKITFSDANACVLELAVGERRLQAAQLARVE